MSKQPIPKIQAAFNKASAAINELETVIRESYDTPLDNIDRQIYQKISIPCNYIRTKDEFLMLYNIKHLIDENHDKSNIAYALMQSDLYNYFINRIHVWGIVEKLLLKTAIINVCSIIEGLIMLSLEPLHSHCRREDSICKKQNRCPYYIKSSKQLKIQGACKILKSQFSFDEGIIEMIVGQNSIRNNIHLSLLTYSEFVSEDYSIENYNKGIKVLNYLKKNQLNKFAKFKEKRKNNCQQVF